jgi:hypothetical protein
MILLLKSMLQATSWWWTQSGANPSLSTCQPVDTHTVVDKRRLTLGGSSCLSSFRKPLKGPHAHDLSIIKQCLNLDGPIISHRFIKARELNASERISFTPER